MMRITAFMLGFSFVLTGGIAMGKEASADLCFGFPVVGSILLMLAIYGGRSGEAGKGAPHA